MDLSACIFLRTSWLQGNAEKNDFSLVTLNETFALPPRLSPPPLPVKMLSPPPYSKNLKPGFSFPSELDSDGCSLLAVFSEEQRTRTLEAAPAQVPAQGQFSYGRMQNDTGAGTGSLPGYTASPGVWSPQPSTQPGPGPEEFYINGEKYVRQPAPEKI